MDASFFIEVNLNDIKKTCLQMGLLLKNLFTDIKKYVHVMGYILIYCDSILCFRKQLNDSILCFIIKQSIKALFFRRNRVQAF